MSQNFLSSVKFVDNNLEVTKAALGLGFDVVLGDVLNVKGVYVSPANSFCFMDGGVDAVYSKAFPDLQEAAFKARDDTGGEILVGDAAYINVDGQGFIIAPTMRTPATNLTGSINPYLAARAAMRCYIEYRKRISMLRVVPPNVVFTGMGTASGGMDPATATLQMLMGIHDATDPRAYSNWRDYKHYEDILRST